MVYLSEHPEEVEKGFELFYTYDAFNRITSNLKGLEGIKELKNILMRLLEEQDRNPALNLVSGLSRFLLDDFKNSDGDERLKLALDYIQKNRAENEKKLTILRLNE